MNSYFYSLIRNRTSLDIESEHNAFAGILKHECGGALVRKFHVVSGKTYQYHVCANARDGKCNVTKNFKNIEVALYRIMKNSNLRKRPVTRHYC
jgi:hypothetical protein